MSRGWRWMPVLGYAASSLCWRSAQGGAPAELAALCAAEVSCCPFFTFDIGVSATGTRLTVTVPAGAEEMLQLFVATAGSP